MNGSRFEGLIRIAGIISNIDSERDGKMDVVEKVSR